MQLRDLQIIDNQMHEFTYYLSFYPNLRTIYDRKV